MLSLKVILDGDGCWPDLVNKEVMVTHNDIQVALLGGGMTSGKSSVSIRIDLPDGRSVVAETSLALFLAAAKAFSAKTEHERN